MALHLVLIILFLCVSICASKEILPHSEVNNTKRAYGDAILEEFSPMIYKQYTNLTFGLYESAFLRGKKEGWKQLGFVCINPKAKTYGGMGNLMLSMLGMQCFGMAIGRVFIINNALLTDIFDHPDPRQKLAPLPNRIINVEMRSSIRDYTAARLSANPRVFSKDKFIGSHGVPTLSSGFRAFVPSLPKYLPRGMKLAPDQASFYNRLMCQGIASWSMSRPTQRAQAALKKYKNNFINKCDASNVPDIAIQVRTLDSIQDGFDHTEEECYVSCAAAKAKAVHKKLQRDICIFVTSNRVSTTDNVVDSLNTILNTDDSNPYKFLYHQAPGASSATSSSSGIMHSGKMVEEGRHLESFPSSMDFSLREDLMDWFLLGEAVHVIGSLGSTFLSTARLRIGHPERHIFNPLQHDVSPRLSKATNFKCLCELHDKVCG